MGQLTMTQQLKTISRNDSAGSNTANTASDNDTEVNKVRGTHAAVEFLTACTLSGTEVTTPRPSDAVGTSGEDQEDTETHSLLGDEADRKVTSP